MSAQDEVAGLPELPCGSQPEASLGATAALAGDPVEAFRASVMARLKRASDSALAASNDRKAKAFERKAHAHAFYAFLSAIVMVEALPADPPLSTTSEPSA